MPKSECFSTSKEQRERDSSNDTDEDMSSYNIGGLATFSILQNVLKKKLPQYKKQVLLEPNCGVITLEIVTLNEETRLFVLLRTRNCTEETFAHKTV